MANVRPRYNVKGRAASIAKAADSGHKRKATEYSPDDSNDPIIDQAARKKLKLEAAAVLAEQVKSAPKMSSKKKKRLEAFVNRKLKKEDRKDLIAGLANTQTLNLALRSSSSLGSKQFSTQSDKLQHYQDVEASRRGRALGILKGAKGKGHLSDEGSEDSDEMETDDLPLSRELVAGPSPSKSVNSITAPTSTGKKPPPAAFNASGSLGIVLVPAKPFASGSTISATQAVIDAESARPPVAPANIQVAVGSGLAPGATVTIVKKNLGKKGVRSEMGIRMMSKGKGKQVESESESEGSAFDSSDDGNDEKEEAEEAAEDSDGGSWRGIPDEDSVAVEVDSDQEEEDSSEDEEDESEPRRKKGAFQAWAESQVLVAAGYDAPPPVTSSWNDGVYVPLLPDGSGAGFQSVPDPTGITGPLGEILSGTQLPSLPPQRTTYVQIDRTEEMQKQREQLPIVKEEDRIMDAIRGNAVVVICGETGSGKTTQIGQFLWEAGWGDASSDNPGMVAITQPRRVAALSTSQRVRAELCLPADSTLVAHRIRYSSTSAADSKLVFMTDGVLLRELAGDFLLSKYSVVVVDEAHERGVNTDVLIGVLSRVARLREEMWRSGKEGIKPLRLIIMSATLRVSDFASNPTLFPKPPPVLHITARQHPVTIHFSRRTSHDYIEEAYKKVARIHARLPPGGILVFCTGQNEIISLVKKLEKKFSKQAVEARKQRMKEIGARDKAKLEKRYAKEEKEAEEQSNEEDEGEMGDDIEVEDMELGDDKDLAADVDDGLPDEDDDPEGLESSDDEDGKIEGLDMEADTEEPMYILPLYSLLSTEKQMKVFADPPEGHRLVVIATNVAETSITIPNVKYVVDAGRAKERQFDADNGIQSFEVSWISKAAAAQRAGRAGRTGPGHCYRIYSSAVFENYFDEHTKPEILRMPIEGIILQMKSMNIDAVANFPFPTPPDRDSLRRAEKTLVYLGALEASESSSKVGGKITELGRSMSLFPLSPRFSKMLVAGQQHGCLPYVIAIVCALSVGDPFIREANLGDGDDSTPDMENEKALSAAEVRHIRDPEIRAKEELKVVRKGFFQVQKKHAALGRGASDVFKMLSVVGAYEYDGGKDSFCEANYVRIKAMQEIHKLRSQISRIVQSTYPGIDAGFVPKLQPPTETQLKVLRQLMTSAFIDQVAIRKDLVDKSSSISYAKVGSTRGVPYRSFGIDEDLFIHPSSGLFHHSPPEFIVYQDLHRTHKVWLKTITTINSAWLPTLGKPLCTFSKPIETPTTTLASRTTKGGAADTRETFVIPRFGSGVGIELKPVKVTQKLVAGRWLFV